MCMDKEDFTRRLLTMQGHRKAMPNKIQEAQLNDYERQKRRRSKAIRRYADKES